MALGQNEMRPKANLPERVSSNEGCAPSMGANLWGASPLWEYRLGLIMSRG